MWRNSSRRKLQPYWMMLPAIAVIGVFFFGGIFEGLLQSFGFFPAAGQTGFSLIAYETILKSSDFWLSLWLTLRVAVLSTLLSGVLGLFISICLFVLIQTSSPWHSFWRRWFHLPFVVPHLAAAYLMVLLFTQSGWFSRIAYHLGFIDELKDFPVLVNEPFGWGIILTYVWKEAPFISLLIYPVLLRIHDQWHDAAKVFGANRYRFATEILLPLLLPAWFAACFIVFAFTFSAFEVPYLLGVTYPKTLPVLAFEWYSGDLGDRPLAMAVGILLVMVTALIGYLAYRFAKRWITANGRGWL